MITATTAVLALILLFVVLQDAFEVILLPRRMQRRVMATRFYFIAGWALWRGLAGRVPAGLRRERFLGVFGPLSLVVLFALWAALLILAFGMLEWTLQYPRASRLTEQIYLSGVTFFTLGYGDVVPHSAAARAVAVAEAGTGIGLIALVIGYLPVLYQLFSRREAHVIQLDARAGSPPTATTMLSRHAGPHGLEKLDELLREWEVWASELLESHLSYPMLVYYRSQHENQSWLAAMTAVIDACALLLVGIEQAHPLQARMTFSTARQVVIEIAETFDVRPSRYTGGDRLPHAEYARMEGVLADAGIVWSNGQATEDALAGLRATYEPLLDGLASALLLTLPEWIAAENAADHWQRGPRGMIARRLIEQLSDRTGDRDVDGDAIAGGRLAQRLRTRLRRR